MDDPSQSNLLPGGPLDKAFVAYHRMISTMSEAEPSVKAVALAYDAMDKQSNNSILISSLGMNARDVETLLRAGLNTITKGKMAPVRMGSPLDKASGVFEQMIESTNKQEPSIRTLLVGYELNDPLTAVLIIASKELKDPVGLLTAGLDSATMRRIFGNTIGG